LVYNIRLYLIALLFIAGCNDPTPKEIDPPFVEFYPEISHRVSPNGYLTVEGIEATYSSHRDDYQHGFDCENSYCRKVDSGALDESWVSGRVRKYTFDLKINDYNFSEPPYWVIIFQDHVTIDPNDPNGNHPITTLKLKPSAEPFIKIAHFDNTWQFDYSVDNPIDPIDPYDALHNHDENRENGSTFILIDTYYSVELIIGDGDTIENGFVEFWLDGYLVSRSAYQTVQYDFKHRVSWGQYWSKFYNTDHNNCANGIESDIDCKSTSLTIKDFRVFEQLNP